MTFEGFDAVPLIEAAGFSPDMPAMARAAFADDSGTLDAARREAARAERAAARAELFAADLWIGHSDARGLGASGRPALEAGTSWRALMPLLDDAALELPGGKDGPLRAAYGEKVGGGEGEKPEEEIIVKGSKPKTMYDGDGLDGIPNGDNGGGENQSGPGAGGALDEPDEAEQNDCRDRHALEAKDEIRRDDNSGYKEHGSIIYRDASGAVRHSPPIEGGWGQIPQAAITIWMNNNGVSFSQVIGFEHNHDPYNYHAAAERNRYPSGGDVAGGDWDAADWFVNNGAGGPGGENFALYIIDTSWNVREFQYKDRELYKDLNADQRDRGVALPDPIVSDGSSCG